jgi:hypothetical protein
MQRYAIFNILVLKNVKKWVKGAGRLGGMGAWGHGGLEFGI